MRNGGQVVPTGQILDQPGHSIHFGGSPVDGALSPNGRMFYIKGIQNLLVVNPASWTISQTEKYPTNQGSMHGMAFNRDGSRLYVTGVGEVFECEVSSRGHVKFLRTIDTGVSSDPCGIAISPDGTKAYACLNRSNTLAVIDLASGDIEQKIPVGVAPYGLALSADGHTAYVSDWGGRHPKEGEQTYPSLNTDILVDDRGIASSGALSIVDLRHNEEVALLPTGLHPTDVRLSKDEKHVYVANANSDTVTVVNTQTKSVEETILVRPDASLPFGSCPNGLAVSADGKTLYVANAGNNAIAVVELANGKSTNSVVSGFIPTDWYPGAVAADSKNLYIVNVLGLGSDHGNVYELTGTADKIPLPNTDKLAKYTATVRDDSRVVEMLATHAPAQAGQGPVPVPAHVGEPSVFKHVLYVIKENKTYDQMFGDLPHGRNDIKLCVFPRHVSPNHHALAEEYVTLDNYYCNGVYSTDGHSWCTEAYATEYWEKSLLTINRSGHQGNDPLIYASSGFIWNNVLEHGLTFTNFGVLGMSFAQPGNTTWLQAYADFKSRANRLTYTTYIGNQPFLPRYSSTNVSGFNLKIPDQNRVEAWLKEFHSAEERGSWPAFNMLYLPDDHTAGGSPGYPTPRAQVADNDLALGRAVEAVTKSSFASNTVIFIIEDDPQSGYDHIDGHRSICLVVSPYTKRGQVIHSFYNQIGLIHTMEQILGLPPMNQMDSMGPLMGDCFTTGPNFKPFTALPNNVPLDEMNPGTTSSLSTEDRFWAMESLKMDFSKPDQIDDNTLNRIIWHSVKGHEHYPSEFVGTHGDELVKLGLIASRSAPDLDDD
jgi:YVTN family beta-propeller protein